MNNLTDILSKREFLYRNYFTSVYKTSTLPQHLTANPTNPLIEDVRTGFLYSDPTTISKDYNRDLNYSALSHSKLPLLGDLS
jgi:hypothetical protein